MNLLKRIFGKKDTPIHSNADFWNWFIANEKIFFKVVKKGEHLEEKFFNPLSSKLDELKEGFFYLTGMFDENTAELILTPDGNTQNVVFVEELIADAPEIQGWKFTALKPALDIKDVTINMNGYVFGEDNLFFYENEDPNYPDEIIVSVYHHDINEENKADIDNGIYIFLDNYLGELDFLNNIDTLEIITKEEIKKELVPIAKLKAFLNWRQKEFIEKYDADRYNTSNDTYSLFESEIEDDQKLFAVINADLLKWDCKASHPWIAILTIQYDGTDFNGMPNPEDYGFLNTIEDELMEELKDINGYLNIGRQTVRGEREIYFACKDFRLPSKVFYKIQQLYLNQFEMSYEIYKDKYWQSFERFHQKEYE